MNKSPGTNIGPSQIEGQWNDLSILERVKMILSCPDHFLNYGLVMPEELDRAEGCAESELEYVINREEQPLFTHINIKKELKTQYLRSQLKAALRAVFL